MFPTWSSDLLAMFRDPWWTCTRGSSDRQLIARLSDRSPFDTRRRVGGCASFFTAKELVSAVSRAREESLPLPKRHVHSRARRACHCELSRKQNPTFTRPRRALEAKLGTSRPPGSTVPSKRVVNPFSSSSDRRILSAFGARENDWGGGEGGQKKPMWKGGGSES